MLRNIQWVRKMELFLKKHFHSLLIIDIEESQQYHFKNSKNKNQKPDF